jgi:uncharacterized protein with PIN domain
MNSAPRFLVDAMLGKLARWLRVLGWDTEYVKGKGAEELLEHARKEERVLLTRRQGLKDKCLIFIETETLEDQLSQLEGPYRVLTNARPFSRCLTCNAELVEVSKEDVKGKVPFFTYETQEHFYRCPSCGRIFWPGSHHKAMLQKIRKLRGIIS